VDLTSVIFSPIYYQHNPGRLHPESARRLRVAVRELKKSRLEGVKNWRFVEPEKASLADVGLVHGMDYIESIESLCSLGGEQLDVEGDTIASSESFEVALHAVGGALKAVNLVMNEKTRNAFALVRPPGHHAGKYHACGFCIFNNVAIATKHLLRNHRLKRILILDIDAHHGNGTQKIFYRTDKVLYISLHEDPRVFPRNGFISEVGEGHGLGFNVNIPLPYETTDEIYMKAMNEVVKPIIRQYKPEFALVSAGFDGHYTDPVGNLSLSTRCYQEVYNTIVDLASGLCKGKLVSVLEGGYSLNFIGKLVVVAIASMCGASQIVEDSPPTTRKRVREEGEDAIREVKRVQKLSWNMK